MWRMSFKTVVLLFSILIALGVSIVYGQNCVPDDLIGQNSCGPNSVCSITSKRCECQAGFTMDRGVCVNASDTGQDKPKPSAASLDDRQGGSHVVAGVLIPLFLIVSVVAGLFIGRRYKVLGWIRNKIQQRRSNYDEFMIGQHVDDDDPPLN